MNRYKISLITLSALAISSLATAQIYKCDGPEGPVYTDRQCGPDAESVKVTDSSGLSGVSDETKAELATKKAGREKAREDSIKRNNNRTVINNQYTTVNTEPTGRWLYPYRQPKPVQPIIPEVSPRPLPSTIGRRRN